MRRRSATRGRHGDYLITDDRTGFTVWRSEARKEWNGLLVHRDQWEARHPQDYLRAKPDRSLRVPDARPEPVPVFIGPLITETTDDAAAGALTIEVVSTARFMSGDRIGVYLADGDLHRAVVLTVDSSTVLGLVEALPGAVSSGSKVINYSAVAEGDDL